MTCLAFVTDDFAAASSISVSLPAGNTDDLMVAWLVTDQTPTFSGWSVAPGHSATTPNGNQVHVRRRKRLSGDSSFDVTFPSAANGTVIIMSAAAGLNGDEWGGQAYLQSGTFSDTYNPFTFNSSGGGIFGPYDPEGALWVTHAVFGGSLTQEPGSPHVERAMSAVVDGDQQAVWTWTATSGDVPDFTIAASSHLQQVWFADIDFVPCDEPSWTVGRVAWGSRGAWH